MRLREGKIRFIVMLAVTVILFGSFIVALINLQIGHGAYYKEQSEKKIYSTETIAAARGNVCDRNGEPLITNRNGYNITISRALFTQSDQNEAILELVRLLDNYKTEHNDTLPITKKAPYQFDNSSDTKKNAIKKLLKAHKLSDTASAEELMQTLCKAYKIPEDWSDADQRTAVGVRYEMELREFSMSNPFVLAEDVSIETVVAFSERSVDFPYITIETAAYRQYTDATIAPHILGRIGKIYAEEYADLKEKGYKMSDLVGKEGIEKVMEDSLRGTNGSRLIERNARGEVLNITTISEPVQGDNVILTIDKQLQITTQNALKQVITSLQGSRETADACAGAAVVVQVNTGEVLASASYPTFNLSEYSSNYAALSKDKNKPLYNRAFQGTYAPGSTFKMATATAVLQEGIVTPTTKIKDLGIFTKYADYQPKCWRYDDYGQTHGSITVSEALRDSCNYFFYQSADELGIDALNNYCMQLGLGSKTGLELTESSGTLAGPKHRSELGLSWYPGDTLQAAIGQSDNLFTPVQLATYLATIVNGGTRYKTHLVSAVTDATSGRKVLENTPGVVNELDITAQNREAIMQGMYLTAAEGTAANVFADYPIHIGCKTGTATVSSGTANGIFVAFAPYENPEIAVAVVVEHGAHGNTIAPIARQIFDTYFAQNGYGGTKIGVATLQP